MVAVKLQLHGIQSGFGQNFFQQSFDEVGEVHGRHSERRLRATRKFQELIDHVVDALDLFANPVFGTETDFWR